jgi:deoxyribonuclease-4
MFGSHLSIAGGMHKALTEAERLSFDTVQVFTKNQQQWQAPALPQEAIDQWKAELKRVGFGHVVSHDSYLINLASPDPVLRAKSLALFDEEITRCDALGIGYLVTHPGAHMGDRDDAKSEQAGLERIAEAVVGLLKKHPKSKTIICLESTAGQGTGLGHRLEHLGQLLRQIKQPNRVGICFDTAHLFAAGYDFRGRKYAAFLKTVDQTVGIDRVKVWHLNDSKKPLGSRVDRHEHIGLGTIGLEGFSPIIKDKRWSDVPKILETPKLKHEDGRDWDTVNLELLKSLRK